MFGRKKARKKADATADELRPRKGVVQPTRQNKLFFYSLLGGAIFLSALVFAPFVAPVIFGLLVAYLAFPIYRFFRSIVRIRSIAAILGMLFILAIVILPIAGLGIALVDEARTFAINLANAEVPPAVEEAIDLWVKTRVDNPNDAVQVQQERQAVIDGFRGQASDWIVERLPATIAIIGDLLIGTFIVAFLVFYIFVDGERLIRYTQRTIPLPPNQSRLLLKETANAVDAIFIGQLFSALLQGLIGGLGFKFFGVPNAFFWGAIMAVLSLLPVIGTPIVWLPAVGWLFYIGDTFNAIGLLLFSAIITMNVDNIVKPILIGGRAEIHPVLVLIGVLGGIVAFGVIGFVLGPLILAILVTLLKVWREEYHDENGWVRVDGRQRAHHARNMPEFVETDAQDAPTWGRRAAQRAEGTSTDPAKPDEPGTSARDAPS